MPKNKKKSIEQMMDEAAKKVGLQLEEPEGARRKRSSRRKRSYGLVRLYDPHPGFAGATVPLPGPMKDLIDGMDGRKMTLEEAVKELSKAAKKVGGKVEVVDEHGYIGFRMRKRGPTLSPFPHDDRQYLTHYFCLIHYR